MAYINLALNFYSTLFSLINHLYKADATSGHFSVSYMEYNSIEQNNVVDGPVEGSRTQLIFPWNGHLKMANKPVDLTLFVQ